MLQTTKTNLMKDKPLFRQRSTAENKVRENIYRNTINTGKHNKEHKLIKGLNRYKRQSRDGNHQGQRHNLNKSMITRINIQQNLKIQTQNAGLKTICILLVVMLWGFLFYV